MHAESYEQAISNYLAAVSRRALAIYQVGQVSFPGLSDLDLLVVPDRPRFDNAAFFDPRLRLPAHLNRLFRHGPIVVPAPTIEALRFSTHTSARLLVGKDLVGRIEPSTEPHDLLALRLEGWLSYLAYRDKVQRRAGGEPGELIAIASSLRFSLDDAGESYGKSIDRHRQEFLDGAPIESIATACWNEFTAALDRVGPRIERAVGATDAREAARRWLLGQQPLPGIDHDASEPRRRAVASHQHLLREFGFDSGDLFHRAAYRERIKRLERRHLAPRALRRLARWRWALVDRVR